MFCQRQARGCRLLARTDDSGISALASLSGRSGHQTRLIRTADLCVLRPKRAMSTMVLLPRPDPGEFGSRMSQNAQSGFLRSRAFPIHAAFDDIFLAIGRRNVRWISIEIGSPNAILRPVLVDPLPQQVRCDPSSSTRRALGAHDIGCKPVSIAATPAAAMI